MSLPQIIYASETIGDKSIAFSIPVAIHTLKSNKIIINYPGTGGSIDGYHDKYIKLANYLVKKKIGAVVRIPNYYHLEFDWDVNLKATIEFVLKNALEICGTNNPEIYLMGMSAGATAIALIASEHPEVKKILLLEPASIFLTDLEISAMQNFKGEVTIVVGTEIEAFGKVVGESFLNYFSQASQKELFEIPNCDHHFTGEINGRILSQAPVYAFDNEGKVEFPDPDQGIKLYE